MKISKKLRYFWNTRGLFALWIIPVLVLIIFAYVPVGGLFIAFKNVNYGLGLLKSPWCGFQNFVFYFTSQDALRTTRNTILFNAAFIIGTTFFSVLFALMLYKMTRRAVKTFQTILFIPYFLSWVVISYVVYVFLNPEYGTLNGLLSLLHLPQVDWYNDPRYWPFILIFCDLWKNVGYMTIIYYTGLLGLDHSCMESAVVDGATEFQKTIRITIPMLSPLIIMMVLLSIGKVFYSDFGLFYFIPKDSGTLYPVTDVIDTYVFRALRVNGDIGMASAVGFYQSICGFILVFMSNFIVKKINPDNALF